MKELPQHKNETRETEMLLSDHETAVLDAGAYTVELARFTAI